MSITYHIIKVLGWILNGNLEFQCYYFVFHTERYRHPRGIGLPKPCKHRIHPHHMKSLFQLDLLKCHGSFQITQS